jgi:photosystem II stability/assembly factor-like uncharacterized protein
MKTIIQMLLLFTFFSQICFAQWVQTNGPYGAISSSMFINSIAVKNSMLFANVLKQEMSMAPLPGQIQISTDNGMTWNYADSGLTDPYVNDFTYSGTEIFIGNVNNHPNTPGGVFISTNNGLSWDTRGLQGQHVSSLLFVNDSCLLACPSFNGIYRSSDKGLSWTKTLQCRVGNKNLIMANNGVETKIFAGTSQGIFLSTDQGESWTLVNNGLPPLNISNLAVCGKTVFAFCHDGSASGYLCRSTNYGSNWEVVTGMSNMSSLIAIGTNLIAKGYFSDGYPTVLLSTNSGEDWTDIGAGLPEFCWGPIAANDSYLFTGTYENGIWRRPLSEIITFVTEDKNHLPDEYHLSQNFPNPFNPSTRIKYSVPSSSKVVIKVFDILGNEIETLVNGEKPAGTYELIWNAAEVSSGVYFYRIAAEKYTAAKKMLLIK